MTRTLKPGQSVGEWMLEELLGAGAFGEVWRARAAAGPARAAALKIPRDERGARLLQTEGATQAKLSGKRAFPEVLGVSARSDPPYVAFELIDGESLRERLRDRGRLPLPHAVATARTILDALSTAHEAGVVHRDLKPENVLLAKDGRVLVTDFGLATADPSILEHSLIGEDGGDEAAIVGSLPYLPPEVREGKAADERGDLYAWGIVLFELVSGSLPGAADLPSTGRGDVPASLDAVYRKAVARLADRYPSAEAAIADLDRVRGEVGEPDATTGAGRRPAPKAKKVDVGALLDRVEMEEREFLAREFVAWVTDERTATARIGGKTYTFDVKGAATPGMAVLVAVSPTSAVILRAASDRST